MSWAVSCGSSFHSGRFQIHWQRRSATAMTSHLKLGAGFANLVDVGQRASVVRRPRLRQAELLDLLKLHLLVKHKPARVSVSDFTDTYTLNLI